MLRRATFTLLLVACGMAACTEKQDGLLPVGGAEASAVAEAHYVRRLYLDLSGNPPTDAEMSAALASLDKDGNSSKTRGKLADALIDKDTFATLFVSELENRVFAGQSADYAYKLVCGILRTNDTACMSCTDADLCVCDCPSMAGLAAERNEISAAAGKLAKKDATTTDTERLYGGSRVLEFFGGSADGIAMTLWENFLGREIEADEQRNAAALVTGSLIPGSPAGLVFHRLGSSYDDLVDIVFTSEVYREAAVGGVFQRYLGRPASPDELTVFTGGLDADKPDVRGVIRSVVSSSEYFSQ